MTKAAVLQTFWSSFGLDAYEENSVPTDDDAPDFPYIIYESASDSMGNDIALSASLWYRSSSWVGINAKAEEIGSTIGRGGITMRCDGGFVWIKRGTPFAQNMGDPEDDMIRRKYINIIVEFVTQN